MHLLSEEQVTCMHSLRKGIRNPSVMVCHGAPRTLGQGMASNGRLRQERKIQEIGEALIAEGPMTLDKKAAALGIVRSTAWFILQAKQKRAGITTATLVRMLESPHLPQTVRQKVLEYVAEKAAGVYGHDGDGLRDFKAHFDSDLLHGNQRRSSVNEAEP
jgi:hypothetical protein